MDKAFDKIHAGLLDAIEHAKGGKSGVIEHKPKPVSVKTMREKTGMSQQHSFA